MSPCGLSVNDGVITHLLSQIPYEPLPAPDVTRDRCFVSFACVASGMSLD